MKSIKPEQLWKNVAINAGVMDIGAVKDIYYALIRTISQELKTNQEVFLPDWGKFALRIHKSRRSINVNTGTEIIIPPKPTVKFYPSSKVKDYFKEFGGLENEGL